MRLYGKTWREIWRDIPLSLRIVVVAGSLFLVFSFLYLSTRAITAVIMRPDASKGPIDIVGGGGGNYFDPAMAGDGQQHVLAYMHMTNANNTVAPEIGLALSTNNCKSWRWMQDAFETKKESILAPDGRTEMATVETRYETPALVYDAADKQAPWKLFAYRYAWMGRVDFAQRYSVIVMKTAPRPEGPWSEEKWILSPGADYPPPPYQSLVAGQINPQNPALSGITSYSRPSVVADRGVLLMSLVAFRGSAEIDRVILMASLDHGARWVYAGTLMDRGQLATGFAGNASFTRIAGASLLQQGARIYLAAVLGDATTQALGTYIIPLADPGKAQLARGRDNTFAVTRYIPRQSVQPTAQGGGYAAYDEKCPIGIVTSEFSGLRNNYQLFRTALSPSQE